MSSMDTIKRIKIEPLEKMILQAMHNAGLSEEDARLTSETLITNDRCGVTTHGTRLLLQLLRNVKRGRIDGKGREKLMHEGPAFALLDACHAFPVAVSYRAMLKACEKALNTGVGVVTVKRNSQFGAAGFYANLAAQKGMFGLAMTNVDPCMAAPGALGKLIGTNPIAFAAPTKNNSLFFDVATSAAAATKVFSAKKLGKKIPEGWLIDDAGRTSTDPSIYPEHGALLPAAGHKGYGLALMVEVLSGVLSGAAITSAVVPWLADSNKPTDEGHFFMALDIKQFMPVEEYEKRMEFLRNDIHNAKPSPGSEGASLPGEKAWERFNQSASSGIPFTQDVVESLSSLCREWSVDASALENS